MVANESRGCSKCLKIARQNVQTILIFVAVLLGITVGVLLRLREEEWTAREISYVSYPGDLFLSMLKSVIIPLVISSLVTAVGSLDVRLLGKIGGKAILYYLSTTILAVIVGIILSTTIQPGNRSKKSEQEMNQTGLNEDGDQMDPVLTQDALMDILRTLFPQNVVQAMLETYKTKLVLPQGKDAANFSLEEYTMTGEYVSGTNIMGLMIFSMALGTSLALLQEKGKPVLNFMESLGEAMMMITHWIIWISPFGVFFLLAAEMLRIKDFDSVLVSLGLYFATTMTGFCIHSLITLPFLYFIFVRRLPFKFILNMGPAVVMAAGTASSLATLPVTLKCLEERNGIDPKVTRFLLPIGATMNMDGMALYEAAAVLFIAQLHGVDLTAGRIISVSITATLASIGAASIPQSGLIMMVMVLNTVGLPASYISYILPIDWLLDRILTSVNVLGDAIGAGIIHHVSRSDLQHLQSETHGNDDDGKIENGHLRPKYDPIELPDNVA